MGRDKFNGIMRLVASIILCVILLPYILRVYLALSPEAKAQEVWMKFVQTAPFGQNFAKMIISMWSDAEESIRSLVDWLENQELDFTQYLSMELAKLIFTGAAMTLVSSIVGLIISKPEQKSVFHHAANAVFEFLCAFIVTLGIDLLFGLYETQLQKLGELGQLIWAWVFTIALGVGGVLVLIALGIVLLNAILLVATGCLKLTVSYGMLLWGLLCDIQGDSPSKLVLGVGVGLSILWCLTIIENLVNKQSKQYRAS